MVREVLLEVGFIGSITCRDNSAPDCSPSFVIEFESGWYPLWLRGVNRVGTGDNVEGGLADFLALEVLKVKN